jgi:hypothetical protein
MGFRRTRAGPERTSKTMTQLQTSALPRALGALAAIACLAATGAQAAPSPLTHHGFAAGSVNVSVGATNQNTTVAAAAGAFSVTWGGATFFTYCVELTQTAAIGSTLDYTLVSGLSYFGSNFAPVLAAPAATVVDRLGRLFTATNGMQMPVGGTLGGWNYTAAQASAAMQLAVWEIVYEGGTAGGLFNGLSLAGGTFTEKTVGHTAIRNLADSFLASAAAVTDVRFDVGVLQHGARQDYLFLTERPQRNDVPLPGTLALAGLGLAGLTLTRRRRG